MNREYAIRLREMSEEVAQRFSNERQLNMNSETFKVYGIYPVSDHSAIVLYIKDGKKLALSYWYYILQGVASGWKYFFPTDGHIMGMMSVLSYKTHVESHNMKYNEE